MNKYIVAPYTISDQAVLTPYTESFEGQALFNIYKDKQEALAYQEELVNNFKEADPTGRLAVPMIIVPSGVEISTYGMH